jgi:RimJ/RimL family protein N-acetyltransferase
VSRVRREGNRPTQLPEPDPPLTDDLVTLRWFRRADAQRLVEICRDAEIPRWTFMPDDFDLEGARMWVERRQYARRYGVAASFAVCDAETVTFVGQCGVSIDRPRNAGEAYYWVAAPARRRGLARHALALVVGYAFGGLGLERVECRIDPANAASQAVVQSCGFTYEGTLRSDQPFKGRRMDSQLWSRLPTDAPVTRR